MLSMKFFLLAGGIGMTLVAVGVLTYDIAMELRYRQAFATDAGPVPEIPKSRWRTAIAFGLLGWAPLTIALGIAALATG